MFRLFSESNDIPLSEIKNGQHLERAKATKIKAFFSSFLYQKKPQPWAAFHIDKNYVYWGKPQKNQVTPSLFNKTAISDIESKIAKYDSSKTNSIKARVAAYLHEKHELIDGAIHKATLEDGFKISLDGFNLELLIPGELVVTPIVPNPETREPKTYSVTFKAVFNLESLTLVSVEKLANQS